MSLYEVTPVTVADYKRRARRILPRFLFDLVEGGANDEETLGRNRNDFGRLALRQRVMRDVSNMSTETTFVGEKVHMPVALAPVGMAGMFARRGEVQAARGANRAGIPFICSTMSLCSVEEIQSAVQQPFWFQLYMMRDRDFVQRLLQRAWNANCQTLVFTVDMPLLGWRWRDLRNGMIGGGLAASISKTVQIAASPWWAYDVGLRGTPHTVGNLLIEHGAPTILNAHRDFIDNQFDRTVTWKDIMWLRDQWAGKLVIKGVLEPDDALAAVDAGADGIIVSNHGGRQLGGVNSSLSKLPAIVNTVGANCEVFLDGGVRSGLDVIKAVALGAQGVTMGRPWVYALAAAGEDGVANLLDTFQQEIAYAMVLMGVNRIDELSVEHLDEWQDHLTPSKPYQHGGDLL